MLSLVDHGFAFSSDVIETNLSVQKVMRDISKFDGCFVEASDGGWRVCSSDGTPIEPVFDSRVAAEQARKGWQNLADQIREREQSD